MSWNITSCYFCFHNLESWLATKLYNILIFDCRIWFGSFPAFLELFTARHNVYFAITERWKIEKIVSYLAGLAALDVFVKYISYIPASLYNLSVILKLIILSFNFCIEAANQTCQTFHCCSLYRSSEKEYTKALSRNWMVIHLWILWSACAWW